MSYADTLPGDGTRARYGDAITGAARVLAAARRERDTKAAAEGVPAIAEAAHTPGGPPAEAIEAKYLELQAAARRERAA